MFKLRMVAIVALALAAGPSALVGCGDDPAGSCDRIAEACHDQDSGSGTAHDCHEAVEAEDATDESCAELEEDCVAACAE